MDVLNAAWLAAGAASEAARAQLSGACELSGACARCGHAATGLTAVRAVVSKVFTGYDGWSTPSGPGLCPACAWAYTTRQLRMLPHLITAPPSPTLVPLQLFDLAALLVAGEHPNASSALIVPLRPGRKHLLPSAAWGRITLDNVALPWTTADANRLQTAIDLRCHGFAAHQLAAPAPPWAILQRSPSHEWAHLMGRWRCLDPWRSPDSPWMALAVRITTSSALS